MKKPTIQEVAEYCLERKNDVDPENFWDYYEMVGWVVGKARKPMKSWQAAVRTWERHGSVIDKKPRSKYPSWRQEIDEKGRELGVQAKPGESYEEYGARVRKARVH